MSYDPAKRYFVTKLLESKGLGSVNKLERRAKNHERSTQLHSQQIKLAHERFQAPWGALASKLAEGKWV